MIVREDGFRRNMENQICRIRQEVLVVGWETLDEPNVPIELAKQCLGQRQRRPKGARNKNPTQQNERKHESRERKREKGNPRPN